VAVDWIVNTIETGRRKGDSNQRHGTHGTNQHMCAPESGQLSERKLLFEATRDFRSTARFCFDN
jgi:hypothetical protein